MATFAIQNFNHDVPRRTLSAEISTLEAITKGRKVFEPLSTDVVGITITGRENVQFVLETIERDREQDIQTWNLVPTSESQNRVPACIGIKVVIFND